MTNASLTETMKNFWYPLLLKSRNLLKNPGTCEDEHAGENAPGTPMITDLPLLVSSARLTLLPGDDSNNVVLGILSPTATNEGIDVLNVRTNCGLAIFLVNWDNILVN